MENFDKFAEKLRCGVTVARFFNIQTLTGCHESILASSAQARASLNQTRFQVSEYFALDFSSATVKYPL